MKYVQCLLIKYVKEGCLKTVAWLPENFCEIYKELKLQDDDGLWNEGWIIQETYNCAEEDYILSHERDWAKQRKASDI